MSPENQNLKTGVEPKVNLEKYQDLEGVTLGKLEFGLWYIEHKGFFYRLIVAVLVVVASATWSYSIYHFAYYLAKGMKDDELMVREMILTDVGHSYVAQISARPLEYFPPAVVDSGNGRYDFAAEIKNVNPRHWGQFRYWFVADGQAVGVNDSFILPGEGKFLLALGVELPGRPASVKLETGDLNWQRIKPREIPDWESFKNDRLKIAVADVKFTPARSSGLSEKINLSQLEFSAANDTAYNYAKVSFDALLYGYGNLAAVNRFTLENFRSGEKRPVVVSWPGAFSRIDKVDVVPEINIMDKGNYLRFESGGD